MGPIPDTSDQVQLDVHLEDQQHPVYHTTSPNLPFDPDPVAGSSIQSPLHPTNPGYPEDDKSPPSRPRPPSHAYTFPSNDRATSSLPGHRSRKSGSWFSLLPFISSSSAKQVRQSIMTSVHDLMLPSSDPSAGAPPNPDEVLASAAESCAKHKLSLSTILQELSIAEHSPMYWAVVDYRKELLVALLKYGRPLLAHTISDIRRACLISSNQALFHALRVRRSPFHDTDGLQLQSLHATSDTLLLGTRPADEVHVEQSGDGSFIATFDITFWQRRTRAAGKVSVEFIASGRIWSITFFSTDPSSSSSSPLSMRGKLTRGKCAWHVLICLLEDSPPTFLDSKLIIEVPPPVSHPPSGSNKRESHSGWADYPLTLDLSAGSQKLGRRIKTRSKSSDPAETPRLKPDTWSENDVNHTNSVVSPLGEHIESHLLYENSRYLFPDGTLRARLEARLVESMDGVECITS